MSKPYVVAIVPARGGSKGVKGKNVRPLGGHPLIAWSIAAGNACPRIDRLIVSTDAPEIADIAKTYGAEVPFLRPAALASDRSPDRDFVIHALDWFRDHENRDPDFLVHLRPTTPLRDPTLMAAAIDKIASDPEATALRSAYALAESPHKMLQVTGDYLTGFFPDDPRPEYYNMPRQAFPTAYQPDGYIDILRTSFIRSGTSLHGTRMLACITPFTVEVDRPEDFEHLEFILQRDGSPLLTILNKAKKLTP
ncbi:MAG TPA: acylneuraminate cytidylyltransferase family protein [Rhizomicrobium sp.]|jgi:CMP-N,N'-diacetyllegionaminic acid synthase|nr:acylneuraminate cytidylyltransferase family protein [Rhizomicrobium sp.]